MYSTLHCMCTSLHAHMLVKADYRNDTGTLVSKDAHLSITIPLKPHLNPQTALGSCDDWPKGPHLLLSGSHYSMTAYKYKNTHAHKSHLVLE